MSRKGFSLIEALTLLFIFSVITITFYSVFSTGSYQIIEEKNRLGALAVANEKMEIARNLDYDALGTKRLQGDGSYSYGMPAGEVLEYESVTVNTKVFSVHTTIEYADDGFDGKAEWSGALHDSIPNDYKIIRIVVSWGSGGASKSVTLVSTFVSKGTEVTAGGGTLSINVMDSAGVGVSQATVRIINNSVTPHVDTTVNTNSVGNIVFVVAAAATQSYRIEVSKNGYYGVTTYAPYPTSSYSPVDVHASVLVSAFNQKTIVLDRSSDLSVATKDPFGADMQDIGFHLLGGRKLGDTTAVPSVAIYSVDQDFDSGTDALINAPDQSSGIYTFGLTDTSRYQLLRLSSDETTQDGFSVSGGGAKNIDAVIVDKDISAALVTVNDMSSGTAIPIQNASVHLSNTLLAYDATIVTDRYGQAYFPETLPALAAGTYDYTVTVAGYADQTGTIVVESGLKTEAVTLTAS